MIQDRMTVGVGGFGAYSVPDELLKGVEDRYAAEGHPKALTIFSGICTGDNRDSDIGHNRLTAQGLTETVIAAHFKNAGKLNRLIAENHIAGYTIPMGTVIDLLRAAAGKKPGVLTRVGLYTYLDPRKEGCAVNEKARSQSRQLVRAIQTEEQDYLFYKTVPMDACLIRGTFADEDGNISLRREGIVDSQLEMAAAVHNNGGLVIVQVEGILKRGAIPAREVRIHHSLTDYVVVAALENHCQYYTADRYHPELTGELQIPLNKLPPMELSLRKVIARRAAMELAENSVINLGIGIPSGVGSVANEEGLAAVTTLSLESGVLGGVPLAGLGFGGAVNPEAVSSIADNFDFYDGGGLDLAFLGIAEVDENGDVNVSRFGNICAGPGGFINITQNTPRVCFMGGFTAEKPELKLGGGRFTILRDGKGVKFVKKVQQVTFSADFARKNGQEVLYITERAVFQLTGNGITLIEIAPGADLQRDILDRMEFQPQIAHKLKTMDGRLFRPEKMGLRFAAGRSKTK